ncbi:MAG: chemotaxis-specific protein-glutamate methyltransferase CheB [Magnetococcales bacterium]|nr:chemotaxis-specific protein-glutamate methyltransferase CheB [Magnetococcales bacterium]
MSAIRVMIVDDSLLVRQMLRFMLEEAEGIEVIAEASNGRQAVELVRTIKPDLVTMDLEMPVMGGLAAIEAIMCAKAVPILVVSSLSNARVAMEAMELGALDVVAKPDASPEAAAQLIAKVRLLSGVTVVTRMRSLRTTTHPDTLPSPLTLPDSPELPGFPRVFAIASSMGGPQALTRILPALPAHFPCPVVIAQHISDGFAHGIVEWLGSLCALPVRLATDGAPLQPGVILISPSEVHFTVSSQRRVALVPRVPGDIYRPSCDRLLQSVAEVFGARAIGIILPGMGSDGAAGMVRIHDKGGVTLAQDEASSLMFGMNQVAIRTGKIQRVLPVESIAAEMIRLANAPVSGTTFGVAS